MSDNTTSVNEGYGTYPWRDKSVLNDLYVEQQMKAEEVGSELGCDESTVLRWLDRHEIPTRNRGTETVIPELEDRDELRKRHHEDGQALYEIADDLGCDRKTVNQRFRDFDIPVRKARREDFGLTENILHELYVDRRQTSYKIADQFGCDAVTVRSRLREHGISVRAQEPPDEIKDGDTLHEMYVEQLMTITEIALDVGCDRETVWRWLHEHDIDSRSTGPIADGDSTGRDNAVYYGASFYRNRPKVLERDNHKCRRCAMTEDEHIEETGRSLDVHHIDPFDPEEPHEHQNRLQNLITLCRNCHTKLQGLPIDNRSMG